MRRKIDELDERREEDEAEDLFRPLGAAAERVSVVSPPEARSGYLVYRGVDGFEAAVPVSVVERCVAWGRKADPNEWYGVIVGKLCEHHGRRHVVVFGVVPDADAEGRPSSVRTTQDSEFRTRSLARMLYPDGIVLGWAHGHLRHGIRFSLVDKANQRTWTQPHSLGIVVDPWHPERLSVYRGPDSELLALVGDAPAAPPEPVARPAKPPILRRVSQRVVSGAKRARRGAVWSVVLLGLALIGRCGWRISERLDALEAKRVGALVPGAREAAQERGPSSAETPASPDAGACWAGEAEREHGAPSGGS